MKFAVTLQENGFPFVSLLDGGFPSLVEALFSLRGSTEPVIIQHNNDAWSYYMKVSGRESSNLPGVQGSSTISLSDSSEDSHDKRRPSEVSNSSLIFPVKKIVDMDECEKIKSALKIALSLNHDHVAAILKYKIDSSLESSN